MKIRSSITLVMGTVIIVVSFLNIFVLVTTGNKADIWLIITALGLILIAMSSMLSEIESQTLIFKNIEGMMKEAMEVKKKDDR